MMFTGLLDYIVWTPSEIAFQLGPLAIRWYSLCWLIGLLLGYLLMKKLFKEQKLKDEQFEPLFIYVFLGILAGARLGHCIFYEPEYFLGSFEHFIEMFIPFHHMADGSWKFTGYQGLASHGGVIGLLAALYLYCRNLKVDGWVVLDNFGICSAVTACFIRLGNLMNSEIVGKITDVPWAFIFANGSPDIAGQPRHPGQLYEAIAYACIFVIIYLVYRKKGTQSVGYGLYFGLCLALIFTFRFFVEYTKEIQVAFEAGLPFDMGQILSIPFIAIGIWSICRYYKSVSKQS